MCLTVDKEKFKIEIAQEDIVVYKVLEKYGEHIISPYCRFLYEIGKEYKTIMEPLLRESCYEINVGFHSFLYEEDAKSEKRWLEKIELRYGDWVCCFRCVIPKGSKIVYGKYGVIDAIVSEEIKIIEEVEL